jgi:glycosyltransferase involved in cell wall biosynthesis
MAGVSVIVHSIHGYGFNCFQPALSRGTLVAAERITSPITTHFVAVSRANLEQGLQLRLFERDRVTLIRSGIELTHFKNQSEPKEKKKRALGFEPRIPLVGMVACFKPQKAPLDFVLMASEVLRALPEVNFALIGDGELRQQIASLVESLDLTQRVFLLGWRRDMPAVMRALDILVLTSLWEGLPRVFPQAMATGLPIVATRVDGAPEAVRDGVNGFLLPPHNPKAMAEKVVELIRFPERAKEMGEQGKESVREFDIRLMMEQQEELYERLLARAQADSPT